MDSYVLPHIGQLDLWQCQSHWIRCRSQWRCPGNDILGCCLSQLEPLLPPGKKKRGRPRTRPRKGKKWKLADLVKSFPTECITVFIYGKLRTFHVVTRDIWIRDVAVKVRVVVIQTTGEPIILLSTDLKLTARQIIILYAMRFAAELGIRDAKQHFGLGDLNAPAWVL